MKICTLSPKHQGSRLDPFLKACYNHFATNKDQQEEVDNNHPRRLKTEF